MNNIEWSETLSDKIVNPLNVVRGTIKFPNGAVVEWERLPMERE
jgi:hypothetical protein